VVFPLNQSNHLTGLKLQVLEAGEELLAQLEHRSLQSRLAGVDGCYIDCAQSTYSGNHSMLAYYQTRIYIYNIYIYICDFSSPTEFVTSVFLWFLVGSTGYLIISRYIKRNSFFSHE
jgi:hypothetical protein